MTGSFLVPIKPVEIPFDDNANRTKTYFSFVYISHYLKHVLYQNQHLIIREDQIFFHYQQ